MPKKKAKKKIKGGETLLYLASVSSFIEQQNFLWGNPPNLILCQLSLVGRILLPISMEDLDWLKQNLTTPTHWPWWLTLRKKSFYCSTGFCRWRKEVERCCHHPVSLKKQCKDEASTYKKSWEVIPPLKLHLWQAVPLALTCLCQYMFCLHKFELGILILTTERFLRDSKSFMVEKILTREDTLLGPFHFLQGLGHHLQSFLLQENNYNRSFTIAWCICTRGSGHEEIWIMSLLVWYPLDIRNSTATFTHDIPVSLRRT